jgi:hypothetical protein
MSVDEDDISDEGFEAELHDKDVDFGEEEEEVIDDIYGVDVVAPFPGVPDGWKPPGPLEGWTYSPPEGLLSEEEIDNPGKWNIFFYALNIKEYRRRIGHFTSSGATVVPEDDNGNQVVHGWKFYYTG